MPVFIFFIIFSYLMGAIPFAYIIAKLIKNVDIRTVGSGNPGATNVYRSIGKIPGIITFILDVLKGIIPTIIVKNYLNINYAIVCGFFCILGHTYTIFLNFKGGKGIATGTGVFLAISPVAVGFAFAGFLIIYLLTKYVSLGSIVASMVLLISVILLKEPPAVIICTSIIAILVIYRHKSNIKKLLEGKETKTMI